ncbi:MAG: metabolite traffic protein EboE [Propylenella sp.]
MLIPGRRELGHLTYCTNIHPGETWPEVLAQLRRHLPAIREEAAGGRPFGLGLRLGAPAAETLRTPAALDELKAFLAAENSYVFTINAFPYGSFHGRPVKTEVYAPDWSTPERLTYTNGIAGTLAELLPDGMRGSVSTVPATYSAWAGGRMDAIRENYVRHAAHLVKLRERTSKDITLALEPEPKCLLEMIDETVRYFETELFGDDAVALMRELTGLARGPAADALRHHLGVCYDVCHAAVEFEDARASLDLLRSKEIAIPKLQLSSALKVERVGRETAAQLKPFDEPVYLHQVVARSGTKFKRYLDLPEALADIDATLGGEWRIHFHVPIFLAEMKHFATTQDFLSEILALHRETPISDHLEVETYTWDVLPERYRGVPVSLAIARELKWVLDRLAS